MGLRLFDIAQEFKAINDLLEDFEINEDTGEIIDNSEVIKELFDGLNMDLSLKLENVAYLIKELSISETALKDEAKRLNEKAKVLSNRQERLKELIKVTMEVSEQNKIKTDKFSFSLTTRKSLNYDNLNMFALDSEFVRVKQEIDKTKISEYVKAGGTVDGVFEVEKTSLTIR